MKPNLYSLLKIHLTSITMKRAILLFGAAFLLALNASSQNTDSSILVENKNYYQNNQIKTRSQIITILANDATSASQIKTYKGKTNGGAACIAMGSVSLVTGIGVAYVNMYKEATNLLYLPVTGEEPSLKPKGIGLIIVGVALDITGFALIGTRKKNLYNSINLYNSRFKATSYQPVQINLLVNSNGIGMRMNF